MHGEISGHCEKTGEIGKVTCLSEKLIRHIHHKQYILVLVLVKGRTGLK